MKKLIEFLKEHKNDKKLHKITYSPPDKQSSEYTFEEFYNNVIDIQNYSIEELWEAYQCTNYIPGSYEHLGLSYEDWLYESEMIVLSSKTVFEDIKEKFGKYFTSYDNINNKYSEYEYYKFYGNKRKLEHLLNKNEFVEYMNFANWSAYLITDKHGDCLLVKPNKTEVMTDKVYSYKFIYHYCPKFIWKDKISKYGLNPKHKFGSKYEKIYCFYSKDPINDMQQWARIKVNSTDNIYKKEKMLKDNFVILTIDLSKCKEKIRFYKDEESNSSTTFYTFEPIPPFAIVNTENMNVKF